MIIDSAIIEVHSGKGGDGCVAFHREKFVSKGGPSGGNGGNGGDVVLLADPQIETLMDFSGRHHWKAQSGTQGASRGCYGEHGNDIVLHLPVGTLVYVEPIKGRLPEETDLENDPDQFLTELFMSGQQRAAIHAPDNSSSPSGELLVDLSEPGMRFVVAKGGKGGRGNIEFAHATNQTPREAEPGEPAQIHRLRLELKLMADVGLLGKPNAGKSTFLGAVSKARPKIADYPFTTLVPQLGIAELPTRGSQRRRLVIADIPGLIENAHQGAGMGVRFLRHVERTRVLFHLLDPLPTDGTDAASSYRAIRAALEGHSPDLASKPEVVAISKSDLIADEAFREELLAEIEQTLGFRPLVFSAATGEGVKEVLEAIDAHVHQANQNPDELGWKKKNSSQ